MINGTPSQEIKINLQLFNDGEPVETTAPVETPNTTETPVVIQTETPIEQPKIKVKYNHQEMELPYEEAVTHIQKGMNYEKAIERERQTARDSYIAEQGYEWNGKPITTEAEYKQAILEKQMYDKYQEQGLPEEVIAELVESKKFREEAQTEKLTKAEQERQNAEYMEFFDYFKTKNGREFDTTKDVIPQEVWQLAAKGKTLADAYAIHRANELEAKVAEYEAKLNAQTTNQLNASSSTGSVTGNGNTGAEHISYETFEANKHDQGWINKNYKKIMESRTKW